MRHVRLRFPHEDSGEALGRGQKGRGLLMGQGGGGARRHKDLIDLPSAIFPPSAIWLCPGAYWEPTAEEEAVPEGLPPHRP